MLGKNGWGLLLAAALLMAVPSARGNFDCCYDWGLHPNKGADDMPPFPGGGKRAPFMNFARCTQNTFDDGMNPPNKICFKREWRQVHLANYRCELLMGNGTVCVNKNTSAKVVLHAQKGKGMEALRFAQPGSCSVTTGTACVANVDCPNGETCNGFIDDIPSPSESQTEQGILGACCHKDGNNAFVCEEIREEQCFPLLGAGGSFTPGATCDEVQCPTVTAWGIAAMGGLVLAAGAVVVLRRRRTAAA